MHAVAHVSQIITLHQFCEILYMVTRILKIPGGTAAEQTLNMPSKDMPSPYARDALKFQSEKPKELNHYIHMKA